MTMLTAAAAEIYRERYRHTRLGFSVTVILHQAAALAYERLMCTRGRTMRNEGLGTKHRRLRLRSYSR